MKRPVPAVLCADGIRPGGPPPWPAAAWGAAALPAGDGLILEAPLGEPLAVRVCERVYALDYSARKALEAAGVRVEDLRWDSTDATPLSDYHDHDNAAGNAGEGDPDDTDAGWVVVQPEYDLSALFDRAVDLGLDLSDAAEAALETAGPDDDTDPDAWIAWGDAAGVDLRAAVAAATDPDDGGAVDPDTIRSVVCHGWRDTGWRRTTLAADDLSALILAHGDEGAVNLDDLGEQIRDADPDDGWPMMSVGWPVGARSVDPSDVAAVRAHTCCTVTDGPGGIMIGLCGGGMDLTWDIALAYVLLGYRPPATLQYPRFAGTTETTCRYAAILAIAEDTCRSESNNLARRADEWHARRTARE